MENKMHCPFCGRPMTQSAIPSIAVCTKCNFTIDASTKEGRFSDRAPEHLLESVEFLKDFRTIDPLFVMAKNELFTEGFKASDCLHVYAQRPFKESVKGKIVNKISAKNVQDMHLIAGKRLLTKNLIQLLQDAIIMGADDNPLIRAEVPDYRKMLWLLFIQDNYNVSRTTVYNYGSSLVARMYFAPNTEFIIYLLNLFTGASLSTLPKLNDECAMYSLLMNEPCINIKWGKDVDTLKTNIISYVSALTSDLPKRESLTNVIDESNLEKSLQGSKFAEDFKYEWLLSQPSIAVNNCKGQEYILFDIMNNEVTSSWFKTDDKIDNKLFMYMTQVYTMFHAMYEKYAYPLSSTLGIPAKERVLATFNINTESLDSTGIVLRFWELIHERLESENV